MNMEAGVTILNQPPIGGEPKFYVLASGQYMGSISSAPDTPDEYDVPEGWIEVPYGPDYADQVWMFPGYGPSMAALASAEAAWRGPELIAIAAQLDAIEEAEAGEPPVDLLPGTRTQWLSYRGKVRNWVAGAAGYPYIANRPVRPT